MIEILSLILPTIAGAVTGYNLFAVIKIMHKLRKINEKQNDELSELMEHYLRNQNDNMEDIEKIQKVLNKYIEEEKLKKTGESMKEIS